MTTTDERVRRDTAAHDVPVETVSRVAGRDGGRVPRWVVKTLSPIVLVGLWQLLGSTGLL
ncbi:ABC transporter permease, partial [Pseudonocardia sp. KRD-291]|nr:ABC transporter permease [Pseudonocardia sp. KRD291]